jgi:hypothetical protein
MQNLYAVIRDNIVAAWDAGWTHAEIPVLWRGSDSLPEPDPNTPGPGAPAAAHFFRNEVDFGLEEIVGYGAGRFGNFRQQNGSLILRSFSSLALQEEDVALSLMSDAVAIFRSTRSTDGHGGDLSFIVGSGFDWGPTEDGNWFMRGYELVFQYRFYG